MIVHMLLAGSLFITGCGDLVSSKSKGSSDASPGGFLDANQFKFDDSVRDIEPKVVANQIRSINFIYLKSPSSKISGSNLTEDNLACAIKHDDIKFEDDQLVMWYEYDDSTCTEIEDKYINRMRVYIRIGCSGQDLSGYTDDSVRQHVYTNGATDFCPNAKKQTTFINAELERESATEVAKVIGGVMGPDGAPCVTTKEDDKVQVDHCTFYSRTSKGKKGDEQLETTKLQVLSATNLSGKANSIYYDQGEVATRVNNWQGTLKYKAGNVGPTYELKDGNKTLKGSFKGGIIEATE